MSVQVTLSDELVAKIDSVATDRTAFVEAAVRRMLRDSDSGPSEIEKINAVADELNAEAEDVLEYQVIA
jgi:metal-responsive CopG/Arc/MetJ family transcriptional regulator